jgi:hypothetical protein
VEYVGYSAMKYNYKGFDQQEDAVNTVINNTFRNTLNFRVGAELKLNEIGIRGGFAYYGSPYKNSNIDASRMQFSGGVGYRAKLWFLDLAYVHSLRSLQEQPYTLQRINTTVPTASTNQRIGNVLVTLGWKF